MMIQLKSEDKFIDSHWKSCWLFEGILFHYGNCFTSYSFNYIEWFNL